jgi:hypothetical protein
MGDNASQNWSWHNNEINQGYQAKGVVRQNVGEKPLMKIIDMSMKADDVNADDKKKHKASKSHKKEKKHKKEKSYKEKKDKKHKKHSKHKEDKGNKDTDQFNPLLQILGNDNTLINNINHIIKLIYNSDKIK